VWYFAYGSNMNRAIFCERRAMCAISTRLGWLADHRLCFDLPVGPGERGVANVAPEPGARTHGVLYLLTPEDFDRLDSTEGVHLGFYQRVAVMVAVGDGEHLPAFTYRSSHSHPGRKPSPRYMRLLLDGAAEHGLPPEYVRFLETFELAHDERETAATDASGDR
jgi:cation transport regulator ChaC